ncbi:MAG: thermonuclease family protein [Candidatus Eremiobacteraeota bacterium]|nr:thermonuclease family protein [Candidatus Eremiobacteraeota bacterium]
MFFYIYSPQRVQRRTEARDQRPDDGGKFPGRGDIARGMTLNYELVKTGLAWQWKYSNYPTLGKLENEARRSRQGLAGEESDSTLGLEEGEKIIFTKLLLISNRNSPKKGDKYES